MQSRRSFLFKLTAGFAAMALVVVGSVIADELLGTITKVDVEGKKITVVDKESEKEIEVKITDETKQVSKKGERAVDLEKLDTIVKKVQDAGKKGIEAKITHENKVASKLELKYGQRKKKSE